MSPQLHAERGFDDDERENAPPSPGRSLSVHVLATTMRGTRAALAAADANAQGLGARIVLLVPQVVPYAQTLEHPADSVTFAAERFRALVDELQSDVTIRVGLCRPQDATLEALIPRDAVVLVGGRTRRWWPTPEQRAAAALTRAGHGVLFVQAAEKRSLNVERRT